MAKELLFSVTKNDLKIDYFCAGGPGGQHQNKTSSACRVTHAASGAVGESREHREQSRNKVAAFNRMANSPKFQTWLKIKASEAMSEESIDQKVDRAMSENNLKIEVKDNKGRWAQIKDSLLKD